MGILEDYFLIPMGKYYTWLGTLVYGIIFAIAVFGVYKLLQKLRILIDRRFVVGIVPFVVLGSVLRAMKDAEILQSIVFTSPLIYLVVFFIALVALLAAVGVEKLVLRRFGSRIDLTDRQKSLSREFVELGLRFKKKDNKQGYSYLRFFASYHRLWAVIGIVLCIAGLLLLIPVGLKNLYGIGLIVAITFAWCIVVYILYRLREHVVFAVKKTKTGINAVFHEFIGIFTMENSALLAAHLFDATTTFVSLSFFPYYEQHVVSNLAIGFIGPIAQFVLKWVVLLIVLWALDRYLEEKEHLYLKNFLKVAIFILGFSPGLRNALRLGFMV